MKQIWSDRNPPDAGRRAAGTFAARSCILVPPPHVMTGVSEQGCSPGVPRSGDRFLIFRSKITDFGYDPDMTTDRHCQSPAAPGNLTQVPPGSGCLKRPSP